MIKRTSTFPISLPKQELQTLPKQLPSGASLGLLPEEIILNILLGLNAKDLTRLTLTSKFFNKIVQDKIVWKTLYEKHFTSSVPDENYKKAFQKQYCLPSNLSKGIYTTKTLAGHGSGIPFLNKGKLCIDLHNGNFWDKCAIRVLDIESEKTIHTLSGHANPIYSILSAEGKIFSGSADHTIKVWDSASGKLLNTLIGHKGFVKLLTYSDGLLFSSMHFGKIRVWNLEKNFSSNITLKDNSIIYSLAASNGLVFIGCQDAKGHLIAIWHLANHKQLKLLEGHEREINTLLTHNKQLISGSLDGRIKIWNLDDFTCSKTLNAEFNDEVYSLAIGSGVLFSGCSPSKNEYIIKIWDLNSGHLINTLKAPNYGVKSLFYASGKLLMNTSYITNEYSKNTTALIWDFNATKREALEEIVDHFMSEDEEKIKNAEEQYAFIPKEHRDKIDKDTIIILKELKKLNKGNPKAQVHFPSIAKAFVIKEHFGLKEKSKETQQDQCAIS